MVFINTQCDNKPSQKGFYGGGAMCICAKCAQARAEASKLKKKEQFKRGDQMLNFNVIRRNYGHWDINHHEYGRLFRIRGGPGAYEVMDERNEKYRKGNIKCKTVSVCMSYICDELMHETLVVDGQDFHSIESWNI